MFFSSPFTTGPKRRGKNTHRFPTIITGPMCARRRAGSLARLLTAAAAGGHIGGGANNLLTFVGKVVVVVEKTCVELIFFPDRLPGPSV